MAVKVIKPTEAVRNAMLQVIADALNAGTGPGTMKIYTGTQPDSADDAIGSQVLLGTMTLSDPCEDTIVDGELMFDTITQDAEADATGTATWARLEDSVGGNVLDVNVGVTGSGAVIELNTTSIVAGGPIQITSFVITISG